MPCNKLRFFFLKNTLNLFNWLIPISFGNSPILEIFTPNIEIWKSQYSPTNINSNRTTLRNTYGIEKHMGQSEKLLGYL
jgi:hypothetical protein